MAENRITAQRVRNHWQYSWWKYGILAVITVLGIDLLFSVTAYRVPEEKRVQLYLCNGYADADSLQADLWPGLKEAFPEQEELIAANIDVLNGDYYTQIQFSTYVAAREGDVVLLPAKEFRTLCEDGAEFAFLELTPYLESGVIDAEGIDLTAGRARYSDGAEGQFGIPADALVGLRYYGCDPANAVLAVMAYGGNDDVSATLAGQMVSRFRTERENPNATPEAADGERAGEETHLFR